MFYAILKSIKENEIKHMEMRQIVADYITQINYDNEEAIFREEKCKTKYKYANKLRKNGAYANDIALEAIAKMTNFLIGIYKSDERYKQNPWTIIDTSNDEYKGIILLHFNQGDPKGTGHHSGIKLFNQHNLGSIRIKDFQKANIAKINILKEDIDMNETNNIKVLIFNCRSIRDFHKKIFLLDVLRCYEIDIALIQETFLIEEDKLYIDRYKIYRADNQIRRKGVAILINTKLNIDCIKLAADPNGRYLKVRIKNRENLFSKTLSNIYLEPDGNLEDINETIFNADIIGGDMNEANTEFNKFGVYHVKDINISDKIDIQNRAFFDHHLLLGSIQFRTK